MQERTINEDAADIAQVEGQVISGPTKTKRGVGRMKKVLDAEVAALLDSPPLDGPPAPPPPSPTWRSTRDGETLVEITGQPIKRDYSSPPEPRWATHEVEVDGEKKEVPITGPLYGSRRIRRSLVLPYLKRNANKAAKASVRAKKAARLAERRGVVAEAVAV